METEIVNYIRTRAIKDNIRNAGAVRFSIWITIVPCLLVGVVEIIVIAMGLATAALYILIPLFLCVIIMYIRLLMPQIVTKGDYLYEAHRSGEFRYAKTKRVSGWRLACACCSTDDTWQPNFNVGYVPPEQMNRFKDWIRSKMPHASSLRVPLLQESVIHVPSMSVVDLKPLQLQGKNPKQSKNQLLADAV